MPSDQINELLAQLELEAEKYANVPRETAIVLYTLVKILKPEHILEIGTSNGYSTIWLATANLGAKLTTIEKSPERTSVAIANFKKADLPNVELRQGNAKEIIPSLKQDFDFVFIDAAKKEYHEYFQLVKNKLSKEAVIIFDNALSHKAKIEELHTLLQEQQINYTVLPIGKGILVIGKEEWNNIPI